MSAPKSSFILAKTAATIALGLVIASFPIAIQPSAAQLKNAAENHTAFTKAFQPPRNPRRSDGYRTTTGTRQGSCVGDSETAFTILGPSETVGRTASTRPKFVWYLPPSETAYPIQFRLLALNEKGIPAPIHTDTLDYAAGFMTYQLPETVPALSPGQEYRWQIVVVCDANYLSRSLNQELSFEVVPPSADLQQALAAATTEAERALAYGQEGFWYDAIAQVAQFDNSPAKAILQTLLEDLANSELENQPLHEDIYNIAQQLQNF